MQTECHFFSLYSLRFALLLQELRRTGQSPVLISAPAYDSRSRLPVEL